MTVALATGLGLRNEISNKVIGFGGDIQILNYQPNPIFEQQPVSLSDSLLKELESIDQVDYVQAFSKKAGILKHKNVFEGIVLKGIDANFNWQHFDQYIIRGKRLHITDTAYCDSILISEKLSNTLQADLGEKLSVYFVRPAPKPPLLRYFYVSGVFKTDFEDIDNSFIMGDLKHLMRINKWDSTQVGGYEVFLKPGSDMELMASQIRYNLPLDADAISARMLNEQLFQWLELFDLNIAIILIIIIAVAALNMSIALLILILERTQMIGLLKALGSTSSEIRRIFMVNASYLIFRGVLYGNIIGIGLCLIQKYFKPIKLDASTYYVSYVAIDLNIPYLLLLNLGTIVICLLCLTIPSYLVSRISPIKAIRFN
jgi:lipoprotein-releasing system permease protein